jgi:RHS repeat-associated protein
VQPGVVWCLRDAENGLDYFGARYYGSTVGRFTTPDNPKFSEKTDPQSWNLYSYTGNNPPALSRIDPTGENWFQVNGQWEWHDGDEYTYKDKKGKEHTLQSNYTHLLTFEKTNRKTADGATIGVLTLKGEGGKVLGTAEAYSGGSSYNFMTTPNGLYEIDLNRRGGVGTNVLAFGPDGPQLGAYRNGIQEVGMLRARGAVWDTTAEWGTLRANLSTTSGAGTAFYLHGKNLYFTEGRTYTHGCITEPHQNVLKQIFKLDPSGVGEGAKNGRIAVWVGRR